VRLVLRRAIEGEVGVWLGRPRYEGRAEVAPGRRNGCRPTLGGEAARRLSEASLPDDC